MSPAQQARLALFSLCLTLPSVVLAQPQTGPDPCVIRTRLRFNPKIDPPLEAALEIYEGLRLVHSVDFPKIPSFRIDESLPSNLCDLDLIVQVSIRRPAEFVVVVRQYRKSRNSAFIVGVMSAKRRIDAYDDARREAAERMSDTEAALNLVEAAESWAESPDQKLEVFRLRGAIYKRANRVVDWHETLRRVDRSVVAAVPRRRQLLYFEERFDSLLSLSRWSEAPEPRVEFCRKVTNDPEVRTRWLELLQDYVETFRIRSIDVAVRSEEQVCSQLDELKRKLKDR